MQDTKEREQSVYEIGYLIVSSIPVEKVAGEGEAVKKIIADAGSEIIFEQPPFEQELAYTIRRKMLSGGYENYDKAYFGWVKFALATDKIEAVKAKIELHPTILRMLLITTVRENTYLGKHAADIASKVEIVADAPKDDEAREAAPARIEDMDKSIDNLVKEV
jgi:ribosomal protein S6